MKQLKAVTDSEPEAEDIVILKEGAEEKPAEYILYEEAKSNFIPPALHNSLVYSFDTDMRQQGETYITERAALESLTAFSAQNLSKASPLTIANLEMYFAAKDESLVEEEVVEAIAA